MRNGQIKQRQTNKRNKLADAAQLSELLQINKGVSTELAGMVVAVNTSIQKSEELASYVRTEVTGMRGQVTAIGKVVDNLDCIVRGVPGDPNSPGIVHRCQEHAEQLASVKTFIEHHEIGTVEEVSEARGVKKGKKEIWKKLQTWQKLILALLAFAATTAGQTLLLRACALPLQAAPATQTSQTQGGHQ